MIRSFAVLVCTLLAAGPASAPAEESAEADSSARPQSPGLFLTEILRPELAERTYDGHRIAAEPEHRRILSPPALHKQLRAYGEYPETVALAVTARSGSPAEIELQLVYNEEVPFVADRRALDGSEGGETVHWTVYKSDQLTGLRFAVRSPEEGVAVTLSDVSFIPLENLSPRQRLHAFTAEPLRPVSVLPGPGGGLEFEIVVPERLSIDLQPRELRAEFHLPDGTVEEQPFSLPFEVEGIDRLFSRAVISRAMPEEPGGKVELHTFHRDVEGEWQPLAESSIHIDETALPAYELPSRSIEDFAAAASGGELILYVAAGEEGLSRAGTAVPVESVWLAAGNGESWVLEEPLLRTRRDTPWLGGGVTAFSTGTAAPYRYGFFTTIGAGGEEGLSLASARNSWRLSPSARNPFWHPPNGAGNPAGSSEEEGEGGQFTPPPTWRGNAFFEHADGMLLAGLEQHTGGAPQVRLLTSPVATRWVDIGTMPLPDLPETSTWLTSYTNAGGMHYLLAGPEVRLYASEDPLRGWEPVAVDFPEELEKGQLLEWDGQLWLFHLRRQSGRGVICWMPVEETEDGGFRAVREFEFEPPALRDEVQPPPPPLRLETLVR